ncbi:MAG TPA: cell division protein DivIVA, partial [Clostridiales bacterium]|nr:cell division protein DivIVA [Clostridiales bacterium]
MFTPQQIDQVSFGRSTFGGYDMQQVDAFLEPLTEDYVTLYKENALLKSKMRVLVGKLEEYRKNEVSMKDAVINAQKTCDKMVAEAQAKCAQMLNSASAAAVPAAQNSDALVAAENARVQEARKAAAAKISELQEQLRTCIQALDR